VGSGVIGCAVAYNLARRGVSVTLVDDRDPGMGATAASAGMLAPHLEAPDEGPLLDLTVRGLSCFDGFIERVTAESGVPVEYRRAGSLSVALTPDQTAHLSRMADVLAARGVAAELLDAASLRRERPWLSSDAAGALFIAPHGYVSASALTAASVSAARRFGARVARATRVERVRRDGAGARAETADGAFSASVVVLAAGCWSGQVEVEGARRLPVSPVRGQLVHVRSTRPLVHQVTWSEHCYLVPWDDGSVLVGATVEQVGFDERTTAGGVRGLIDQARLIVPGLEEAAFVGARAGLRPQTADGLPVIGASPALPSVIYATGHYRNGILLAPLTADLLAGALLDGHVDPLLAATSPGRFGG
jgi:glycine oxidase